MARGTLDRNVKFKALVKRSGLPKPYVRGLLETMWDVAHESGNEVLGSPEDVEIAGEWPGKPGEWFEKLKEGRWIDELPEGSWRIHDYWDHAPDYVFGRAARESERRKQKTCIQCSAVYRSPDIRSQYCSDACKQAAYRERHNPLRNVTDKRITVTQRYRAPSPSPSPSPLPKNGQPSTVACDELASANSPPSTETPIDPKTVVFPLFPTIKGKRSKAETWLLTEAHMAELVQTFVGIDVPRESRKAHAWIMAHLPRRKTADGMPGFLLNWMERSQNRSGGRGGGPGMFDNGDSPEDQARRVSERMKARST